MDELRDTQYNLPIGTDCISRRKLLDKFEPWLEVHDYNDGERNVIKAVLYEIKCMPPATDTNAGTKLGTNLAEVGTDLINRQVTIDAITDELDKIDHVPQWVFDRLEKRIRQLPSVQPRGKWIYHIDDLFPAESTKECDQCHAEQPLICDDEFCPRCGAKMEVTE